MRRITDWIRTALFAGGAAAVVWSAAYYVQGYLFQFREQRQFERQRAGRVKPTAPPRTAPGEGSVLGRLEIPRLGLSVMVVEGVSESSLKVAAGHIPGTPYPHQSGNVGIAAHRDTFFRGLRKIRKDDVISLSTLNGEFRYAVDFTRIVAPEDVEVLNQPPGRMLTLVTCYPFYYTGPAPQRFIVRARQAEQPVLSVSASGGVTR